MWASIAYLPVTTFATALAVGECCCLASEAACAWAAATTAAPSGLAVDLGLAGDAVPKPANAFDIRLVALEEGDIVDSLMLFTVDEP